MAEEKLLATRAGYGQGLLDIGEKYECRFQGTSNGRFFKS